jgi:hypothetical protein
MRGAFAMRANRYRRNPSPVHTATEVDKARWRRAVRTGNPYATLGVSASVALAAAPHATYAETRDCAIACLRRRDERDAWHMVRSSRRGAK